MTPEQYNKVKQIFLEACDKPADEQTAYLRTAAAGDATVEREAASLLREHHRGSKALASEPEGPLGPMSAILSRANIHVGGDDTADHPTSEKGTTDATSPHESTHFLDDSTSSTSSGSGSGYVDPGRFAAGTVAAGRYRIIELLGRGGMGEVYRADDILLNQSIALKFLPALFGSDQKWLERFRNEVRLARQVTHPNVCRVFDIGEFQGEQFISMEYIDGENLASLLRRIGRVPHDKATQIGRQLCAGLAAAHDRGVLHRDLKPANVMIDGRGSVRITDFGLAAPADQLRDGKGGAALRAGTPAYMSPEQLAGKPVTVRSDVYSLGLVLYEMFTGRRAFKGESLRDYQKLHSSEEPTPPSEILDDIDPIVERVILKCLEKDPKNRPASAMAVSAALPGGNPLREILAAGETPSPEVVAAAGEAHGVLRPRLAVAAVILAVVSLVLFIALAPRLFVVQTAIREKQPAVLTDRARTILRDLGYAERPRDAAGAFAANAAYYVRVEAAGGEKGANRLALLARARPGLIYYWYRQSPELLIPLRPDATIVERDPAPILPGMVSVRLDPLGRLIGLRAEPTNPAESIPAPDTAPASGPAAPPPSPAPAAPAATADWSRLLAAAEVDLTAFKPVAPQGAPPVFADERAAWIGSFPDAPAERVRVEAAAYHGRPVYFAVIGEWQEEQLSEDQATLLSLGQSNLLIQTVVIAALLVAGSVLAWKNYRTGRGDRQGATRMALAFFLLGLVMWVFKAHHVSDPVFEFLLFQRGMGPNLYLVCLIWIFYMALEPYVRRVWPEAVISWSRLLSGKWMDPLVGRDVLAGGTVGALSLLLTLAQYQVPRWLHLPAPLPSIVSVQLMLDATGGPGTLFSGAITALYLGLLLLLFLVLVRMVTRQRWIAAVAFVLVFAAATARYSVGAPWYRLGPENVLSWTYQCLLAMVFMGLLMRYGLVGVIFCLLVRGFTMDFPVTWDFSVWYANASIVAIVAVAVILGAGFYAALGGRRLLPAARRLDPAEAD
jgi:serine/threonine-protein kinase